MTDIIIISFNVLLNVLLDTIKVLFANLMHNYFIKSIVFLYMFRASLCPSSGGLNCIYASSGSWYRHSSLETLRHTSSERTVICSWMLLSIADWIIGHVFGQRVAHSRCDLYSCSFSCCFSAYWNFNSWFILWRMATFLVLSDLELLPFTFTLVLVV